MWYDLCNTAFRKLWGQKISNPVGLAAGFDKDGEAIDGEWNRHHVPSFIFEYDMQGSSTLDSAG